MNRFFIVLCLFINSSFAQLENNILFKVNDSLVYVDEFNRVYNKNIDLIDENNQKDFESYLELFINYKLKLAEAYDLGLQNDPKYKSELNKYVKQLQNTYLTDRQTEDKFLREAYERTKYEVNVSHVLIRIDENDNDTIDVYNKLNNLRGPFLNSSINDFKNSNLEDEELIIENLGYFSAFKMIYNFENMAYNTSVGEVSMPFRSRFGFHILKVNDKRPSLGEVTVGHIMTYKNKPNAFERITNISDSLNNGVSFEYLAKKYSDDKNSSFKGGRLNPFSSGQINSIPFENAAFELGKKNNISKPIETKYGWHIIKFYSKKNLQKFDEIKYELLNKLKKSSRFSIISDSFYDFLINRYGINYQNKNLNYFVSILNPSYFKGEWSIPELINEEEILIKISDRDLKYIDFAIFLEDNQRKSTAVAYEKLISEQYKSFVQYNVLEVYKSNLESENSDYKYVIKEYKEGLLLFNLMQDKIWTVRDSDSTKLKMFFDDNKNKYSSFEEDRGKVIGDFQQLQEELWLKSLKSKHKLTLNKRTIKRLKKEYN
tara:strand:+ start:1246 stop:2877 length:1632 start_codon:yes stop_codon:yes gene_type:complete